MSNYWQKRFEFLENQRNKVAIDTVQSITPAFNEAQAKIEKEINAWYGRFAKNNEISLQEAKKLLNTKELKEFRWDVQEYIKYGRENAIDQKWMKELENASARFHISRLEALKIRTQNAAEQAFGNELDALDEMAARIYMDDYYHTAYEIQKGLSVGFDVSKIDQRKLDSIVSKPWTTDKMTFSDRIWKAKTQLLDSLHTELTQMCILGKEPDEVIRNISQRMGVSKGQAGRLVMTEAAYFGSVAQKDCFNDLDVEKYEVVATLDNRTSEVCQKMDGQVFDMKDFQAGVTAPPFHCWCRSCTAPWFEDNNDGTRVARDEEGKTYEVPASMKYEDWKKTFVDGGSKDDLKVIDTVEDLKKMISDKESEIEGLKNQMKTVSDDHMEWKKGNDDPEFQKYDSMSKGDFQKYSDDLKKQQANLDDEYKKIEADYNHYYERPDRRSPERAEWNKWHEEIKSKYGVDSAADLFDTLIDIQNKQSTVRKELNKIDDFSKWKIKFGSKTQQDFVDEIANLTFKQQDVQKEIEDLKKQLLEALKNRKVGDSFKEKIQNLKDAVSVSGKITEDDIQEAGKLFQEELLKDKQFTERIQKIDDLNAKRESAYEKYKAVNNELYDFRKQYSDLTSAVDDYEYYRKKLEGDSADLWYKKQFDKTEEKLKSFDSTDIEKYRQLKSTNDRLSEEYSKLHHEYYDTKKNFEIKNADDVKRILSQVREMGSDGIDIVSHLNKSRSSVRQYIEQAYSYYPKDWVKASVKRGNLSPKKVQRGYYSDWDAEIAISGDGISAFETSLHELGHRMEKAVDGILKAEKVFYDRRTTGESLEWLGSGYKRNETTRKDNFLHPYMGKDYGEDAYELVSMGFQMGYMDPKALMKDSDMANFIYGLLTLN